MKAEVCPMIISQKKFADVPGDKKYELPPLLLSPARFSKSKLDIIEEIASRMTRKDDMLVESIECAHSLGIEERRLGFAESIAEKYCLLVESIRYGRNISQWIAECRDMFRQKPALKGLIGQDIWPHVDNFSFVSLLKDKEVKLDKSSVEEAFGLHTMFRTRPPLASLSIEFLYFFSGTVGSLYFNEWVKTLPSPQTFLPRERFHFEVVSTDIM